MSCLVRHPVAYLLLLHCLFIASCAPSINYTLIKESGTPKGLADRIDIYLDDQNIPRGVTVIGEVHVGDTGLSVGCGYNTALSLVKDQAREVGADAAYLVRVLKPDILSTCYRVTARLLQYPSSVTAVAKSSARFDDDSKWRRMATAPTAIIELGQKDKNPSPKLDNFERSADAVVALTSSYGTGTALLITRDGLALTNHHVIEKQDGLKANLRDGRQLAVRVLRTDSSADVALIEVNCTTDCFTLDIGHSNPRVGRDVYVIGNPLTLNYTLTTGVVSGLRLIDGITLVQTDAALNHGNSGGPIIDAETGTVLAIVAWKIARQTAEGLGFGIAIQDTLRVLGIQWR